LEEWLSTDLAINDERRDLFRAAEISERLLRRLKDGKNSIALQGAYGAGKTSVIQMAEGRAHRNRQRLWCVKVSCWGFDNSSVVQREALDQIVQCVGEKIDCFAIRGLPRNYIDAITKDGGWLGVFKIIISRHLSPLEQLQRFTPILGAVDHIVVVVVEDVDRNGRGFDLGDVQALLARFREVTGVSFILSISNEQQVDFARLCEFVDVVPTLDEEQALKIVHRVRAMCLDKFDDLLPDGLEQLTADDDRYRVSPLFFGDFRLWPLALAQLLATPRALKFTLRRVTAVWEQMHGEINIDLLIMSSALRATASPVFSFLVENYTRIRKARDSRDSTYSLESERDKPIQQLKADWEKLVATEKFDVRNASVLMLHVLPDAHVVTDVTTTPAEKRQGLSGRRGEAYARRLFSEALVPSEIRDQTILKLMKAADGKAGLVALADAITESKEGSDAFEHFVCVFRDFPLLPLLSEIYSVIRRRQGRRYNRDANPGFFAPWRVMDRHNLPTGFEDWLIAELEKCVPGFLKLMHDIYYFWLGTQEHTRAERLRPREAVLSCVRKQFTNLPVEKFIESFDPAFPYTLFHLIFTSDYETPQDVPFNSLSDWAWIGPILLKAVELSPEEIMPQVLFLLNADVRRGGEQLKYSFDEARLQDLFGDRSDEFLKTVARGFPIYSELDAEARQLIELAIQAAKKRVSLLVLRLR
jgi:hypothetical protein